MTYFHRQGVFRSRLILPSTQRAMEVLSLPAIPQARLEFNAAAGNLTTVASDNQQITIGPLTVENAAGLERLVIVGGTSQTAGATGGDFDACLIDGQVATRVGLGYKAFPVSGPNSSFIAAFRAPGTANTSISVTLTVNSSVPDSTVTNAYAACFKMSNTGTVRTQTYSATNDPTLSANTIINGTAVSGLYGIGSASSVGAVPVFRAASSTAYSAKTSTPCDTPTGTVDGDILVAGMVVVHGATFFDDVIIPPAGWTRLGVYADVVDGSGFHANFYVFWKRASGEGATQTFAHLASVTYTTQVVISAYSGCLASGDPVDTFSQNSASTGSTLTATGITTTSANTKLVLMAHNWDGSGTLVPPTGMTERFEYVAYAADEDKATAGATGNRTQTLASSNPWSAFLIALKPATSGGGGSGALTAWTGLTERFDIETFSVASDNITVTSTPLVISADLTPNLTASDTAVASMTLSFNPVPARTVAALAGSYTLTGTNTTTRRSLVAAAGSYTLTGTSAAAGKLRSVVAEPGSYAVTGTPAGINPSASAVAAITFDATDTDTTVLSSGTYTFPLTVATTGGERLVIVGGVAGADGDYSACTIGGQTGTRVGFVSRGVTDASGNAPFLTAFRAPVTASSSISVVATIGHSLKSQTAAYCACFNLSGVGPLFATTNRNTNDPVLSTDVINNGAVAAALLGYADTTPTVTWSGLTERFDAVRALSTDVFSGASIDISGAVAPSFRSVSDTTYAERTSTAIDTPVGVVDGDILIASIFTGNATGPGDIIAPAGWTQIGTNTVAVSPFFVADFYVFWKRATSEGAFSTFSHAADETATTQGMIAAYSGCIPSGSPIDVFAQNSGNGSTATATAVTTTVANTKLLYVGHNWDGTITLVPPTGMTERFEYVDYLADMDFAGPGSVGPFTQTLASSNPWAAFTIALKPATSPRAISADITPDLTTPTADSIASICLSFLPGGATTGTVIAGAGNYRLTGQPAVTRRGLKTVAATIGLYALTGTDATASTLVRLGADPGAYVLTGSPVATIKGGTNKFATVQNVGAYAITGTSASMRRGRKVPVTTVGVYSITGTTVLTGKGLIAIGGSYALTGRAAGLSKTTASGSGITVSVGSTAMTASVGNVTVTGGMGLGVLLTGTTMTVSVGNETVSASGRVDVSVPVTATQMTASVGNASTSIVGGVQTVLLTGNEMTASVGNAAAALPGQTLVSPTTAMTMGLGTVTVAVPGSTNALVVGNRIEAQTSSVTVRTSSNIAVTGTQMTVSVGSVTFGSSVSTTINSDNNLDISVEVGTVTVSAKQNAVVTVEGTSMVAYVGRLRFAGGGPIVLGADNTNKEGQMLRPSNWMGG